MFPQRTFLSTLQAIGQKGSNMTHLIIEFISVILVTMMLLHIILLITGNEKDSFIEITNFSWVSSIKLFLHFIPNDCFSRKFSGKILYK